MKLKFEEAISVPESERRSIADSIDCRSIGIFLIVISVYLLLHMDHGQWILIVS